MSRGALGPWLVVVALAGGILVGERLGPARAVAPLALGGLAGVIALMLPAPARLAAALLAAALLGGALVQRSLDGLVRSPLAPVVDARADVRLWVSLAEDPDGDRFAARVLARVHARRDPTGGRHDAGGRTVLLRAGGDVAARLRLLEAGDRAEVDGWLHPLDGFDRRLRWRHAVGTLEVTALDGFGRPRSPLLRLANRLRALVLAGGATLPAGDRALLAGFLLGDTRAVPERVADAYRAAGLSHLLAVSGANVAFVLGLAGPLLRRVPRPARLVLGLGAIVVFGTMTRWEPSVLRAATMAAAAMVAVHAGRPQAGARTLALAVGALLLVDPFLVHSVGFRLSCGAALGLVTLGPAIVRSLPGPPAVRGALGATIAAQLGVAPVLLPVFGAMPLVALPANLVAVPLAEPLTMWGLAAGAAGGAIRPVAPTLAAALQVPSLLLLRAITAVASAAATVPVELHVRSGALVGALGALGAAVRRSRRLRRDAPPLPAR